MDIELEVGETVEIIYNGERIDAFLSDRVMVFDPASIHSRLAARTYAYSVWADGDKASAMLILKKVGREG